MSPDEALRIVEKTCDEFLDAIDTGWYRTADVHLRADFVYLRDVARRGQSSDDEPCGGTCRCGPLHARVREFGQALETLRTLYWRDVRAITSPAAPAPDNQRKGSTDV